ncbi:hypothetical protein CC80DRAFT_493702 [Byssothecium circinans]|uniref:Uncharacterized protein n=1 Tax=Byssothecium circinans TaxID=147558 RepID=A0A6A5TV58_9PLEO|nr:hypothetical protein CC80DRAFT_493702 [Byssothecium circinans]
MVNPTPGPLRTAYIRTSTHHERDLEQFFNQLRGCVRQPPPDQLTEGGARHRFLLGVANLEDNRVLDMLIAEIGARTPTEVDYANPTWCFKYVSRFDIEVRISRPQAATVAGQKLLKRCADNGIATTICGTSDEQCDSTMLMDSDYLIDPMTMRYSNVFHTHFWQHFRSGIPEDNMLTNEKYDMKQHDASRYRLAYRYAGYSWRQSSGGYRGNGDNYRCAMCGGKCKRSQCRGQAPDDRIEERKRNDEVQDQWREENLRLPEPGTAKWKDSTADEMLWRFQTLSLPGYKNEKRWHSIDTFSGE